VTLSHADLVDFVLGVAVLTSVLAATFNALLARRYAERQAAVAAPSPPLPPTASARRPSRARTVGFAAPARTRGRTISRLALLLAIGLSVTATVYFYGPNVLDMQSATLLELCMFAWLLAGIYGVQRFFEVERRTSQRRYLALAGASCALALLSRYEGWLVTSALLACVVYGCARRGDTRSEVTAYALAFSFFPALALALWLAYVMAFGVTV
jgi:hypothetical protein